MEHIVRLDADVLSIEASRSGMEVLEAFAGELDYPNEIGPGVYDIHSPRVPCVEEIERLLELAEAARRPRAAVGEPGLRAEDPRLERGPPGAGHMVAAASGDGRPSGAVVNVLGGCPRGRRPASAACRTTTCRRVEHVVTAYDVPFCPQLPRLEGDMVTEWLGADPRRCGWSPDARPRAPAGLGHAARAARADPPPHRRREAAGHRARSRSPTRCSGARRGRATRRARARARGLAGGERGRPGARAGRARARRAAGRGRARAARVRH